MAAEPMPNASNGCRCERCWTAAEFFKEKLGSDYGLPPAPGGHDSSRLPSLRGERDPNYVIRAVQLMQAEQRNQEDDEARRRGLEPLTHDDRRPADAALRARQYR